MQNNKVKSVKTGKERALYLLQRSDKTEYELRNKLKQGLYSDSVIEEVINFLKAYHYIDDEQYTRKYISYKTKTKSVKQIKMDLYQKGITPEIIKEVFNSLGDSEEETIKKCIEKKRLNWETIEEKDIHKLISSLMRRGFPYEQIMTSIKEFKPLG